MSIFTDQDVLDFLLTFLLPTDLQLRTKYELLEQYQSI